MESIDDLMKDMEAGDLRNDSEYRYWLIRSMFAIAQELEKAREKRGV